MAGLEAAGFEEVTVEFTHEVADGMHGAIVKAVKTRDAGGERAAGDPARSEGWLLLKVGRPGDVTCWPTSGFGRRSR